MQQWTDQLGVAQRFIGDHTIDVLMAVIVALGVTLLLALWSLSRRAHGRRIAGDVRDLQRRLEALEYAENERMVRRIVTADQPPA